MAISSPAQIAPTLLAPIASGVGTPPEISLAYGGGNYIIPNSGDTVGSMIENTSSPASTNYTTALSYTGSGYLEFLAWWGVANAGTAGTCVVKLTIDGKVIFADISTAAAKIRCAVGSLSRSYGIDSSGTLGGTLIAAPGRMPFTGSILIEHKYATATGGQVAWKLVKAG